MEPATQRFPKSDRIRKRSGFRRVYENGRKVHGRLFTAFVVETETGDIRLGLTVTRKVGPSHERNRCRRLLREAFRRLPQKGTNDAGADVVINAKREMIGAGYAEVEAEMHMLLTRIRR